jgi:catechol 2,3-dioxygenase-like lactoylglutathione lyase family enzyme
MLFTATQIDHVEVIVRDLDAAARWYREVFGLVEQRRWDPEPVMIGGGPAGPMLALFQADSEPATRPPEHAGGGPHWHRVAWRTDREGFAAAQQHLRGLAIPFRGPVDHDIAWSIYFHDPDGNPLEITYYL